MRKLTLISTLLLPPLFAAERDLTKEWPVWDNVALLKLKPSPENPGLIECVPKGIKPLAAERALVLELAELPRQTVAGYDQNGHIMYLFFSDHGAYTRDKPKVIKENLDARTGLTDTAFRRLTEFPALKGIVLYRQPLSDAPLDILAKMPQLEVFWIEYHGKRSSGKATSAFIPHINYLKKLRVLGLKHLFSLKTTHVDQLGAFPNLEVVELDNASATNKAVTFLQKNPTIKNLELHRSMMTNADIQTVLKLLPNLERFVLKPGAPAGGKVFDHTALAGLKILPKLQHLGLHFWKEDRLIWKDGLEHVAAIKGLKQFDFASKYAQSKGGAKLKEARPDLF